MSWKRWKLGAGVSLGLSLLVALAGMTAGMTWRGFLAVFGAAAVTHFGAFLVQHPVEQVTFDDAEQQQQQPAQQGNDSMKKIVSTIAIAVLALGLTAQAQTNTGPIVPGVTNLESGAGLAASVTNLSVNMYGVVTDQHKIGGGFMAVYNFNNNVGTGLGVEDLAGNVEVLNGNVTLRLPIHPFGFIGLPDVVAIPWATALIGRSIGSGGGSGAAFGSGGGLSIDVADLGKGWALNIGGGAINWTGAGQGFDGWHYIGFLGVHHGF